MQLNLSGVSHYYGRNPVLTRLSLALQEGEIGALIGPSGAGKSTALNCIAGLEPISAGEIHIGGRLMSSAGEHVPPERRMLGMMFQDGALFPHLDVRANIAFGLGGEPRLVQGRVDELLGICQLDDCAGIYPHELSGGQQQRVAVARALAPRPRLLLLDEPFSDCDMVLRDSMVREVGRIIRQQGSTALLVTHDQAEAFAIADRCGVIDAGTICQWDTAYNLYHRPNCVFVASFIGESAMIGGRLLSDHAVETELGQLVSSTKVTTPLLRKGGAVKVMIRPDDVVLVDNGNGLPTVVTDRAFRGADFNYTLQTTQGTRLKMVLPSRYDLPVGDTVTVGAQVEHLVVFPTAG